jgi:hypothetical protein
MLDVIATALVKSCSSSGAVTARIDSLFVRTRCPSLSESLGRLPRSLQLNSSLLVPNVPAPTTTPRAVSRRRPRRTDAPERSWVTV